MEIVHHVTEQEKHHGIDKICNWIAIHYIFDYYQTQFGRFPFWGIPPLLYMFKP